jgi:hypothetical protein
MFMEQQLTHSHSPIDSTLHSQLTQIFQLPLTISNN